MTSKWPWITHIFCPGFEVMRWVMSNRRPCTAASHTLCHLAMRSTLVLWTQSFSKILKSTFNEYVWNKMVRMTTAWINLTTWKIKCSTANYILEGRSYFKTACRFRMGVEFIFFFSQVTTLSLKPTLSAVQFISRDCHKIFCQLLHTSNRWRMNQNVKIW